jgi:photosystem II stability/assembly factor-like uncharacterized protein
MRLPALRATAAAIALLGASLASRPLPAQRGAARQTSALDSARLASLTWRNIGPYRGGRVTAVAGIPGRHDVFYMGATGGGVWKTEDGGLSWRNVSDGFFRRGSVGAIAVAPSDPNVVWVGTGEAPIRGVASSYGDGVYRSTDAGRTWTHLGLDATLQISRIVVHPTDPDVAWVAAQGNRWAASDDRGIYRTTDGGRTWTKQHFVAPLAGPSDLAIDPTNPRILYAAYWDHQRTPWQMRSGGPNSGIWKTTDGGVTWTRLSNGLPSLMGKIGVAVSADPNRIYAIVEAEDGGLFRSDDAGRTWRRTSDDRLIRARAWYYTHITADPANPDVVWVMNAPLTKSIDGGRTFTTVPTPHGDNHALWIDPTNPRVMINGNDGGANVSRNGGASWTTQGNQPTAQFYRVATDARRPYWVYAGQQDNSTVAIPSRVPGPGIDITHWTTVGGCESAHVAFDPRDPRYVYAGCYQGIITEVDQRTGRERRIQPYPALGLGVPSDRQQYRFNWNAPIVASPHDPSVIYHAGNVVFRTTDRGATWTPISPDLTRNDPSKLGPGGAPITNEGAGGEVYQTIYALAESPLVRGELWAGTDDGRVHVTRDAGATWTDVSPRGLGETQVTSLEISPHARGTVYLATTRTKWGDNAPMAWKTTDGGASWARIDAGFRAGEIVRVVREDPVQPGLLYAGTETGVYVSIDGGTRWQPLPGNLPVVPVTDLQVRQGDLVAATEGRAFWILDDLTPLREMAAGRGREGTHLFPPAPATLWAAAAGRASGLVPMGQNPPAGALLQYALAQPADSANPLVLTIADAQGRVVRTLSSAPVRDAAPAGRGPRVQPLPARAGLNRGVWDLRTEAPTRVPGLLHQAGTQGAVVPPGRYTVTLSYRGATQQQPLVVEPDPALDVPAAEWERRAAIATRAQERLDEVRRAVVELRTVRTQVAALVARARGTARAADVEAKAAAVTAALDTLESSLVQPKWQTFQDVINFPPGLDEQIGYVGEQADGAPPITGTLEPLYQRDVPALNAAAAGLEPVQVPRVGPKA